MELQSHPEARGPQKSSLKGLHWFHLLFSPVDPPSPRAESPQGEDSTSHHPSFQPLALVGTEGGWVGSGHLLIKPGIACQGRDLHGSALVSTQAWVSLGPWGPP